MKKMMEQEFASWKAMMDKLGKKLDKICSYTIICLEVLIYVNIDFLWWEWLHMWPKMNIKAKRWKRLKGHLIWSVDHSLVWWLCLFQVVGTLFVLLCLQMSTFMEVEEMRVLNLLVSFVSSQVYHRYSFFFMINCEVLTQWILWWWEIGKSQIIRSGSLLGLRGSICFGLMGSICSKKKLNTLLKFSVLESL